ncbi:MAG: U32 family peptidase [Kiritimatiellae bacterium]|nr:U32 family peptidase [Kiritimatiellia bacterium]
MKPELLSPAGNFDAALAAFQYGADAVYLGLPRFSARAEADNLTPERVRVLLAYAKTFRPAKKVYITLNTVIYEAEIPALVDTLGELAELRPDGLIVQDLGLARIVRQHFPELTLHASTQLAAHSLEGVLALKELGFTRVVLARELTLDEIRAICDNCGIEIEIFIHGALCYSVSGLCLFSALTRERSGNRGRCAYCCREAFSGSFPFSMRDLALAPVLDKVTATGAASLKIEGRMKSPLYVACVTDYYRKKLDGALAPREETTLVQDLQTIFSRPWTRLYAEGRVAQPESIIDPIGMGHRGARIGQVESLRKEDGARWLRFTTNRPLEKHDGIQIDLPQGGRPYGCAISLLRRAHGRKTEISVPAGTTVEIALPRDAPFLPAGAPVFCSASQEVKRRYEIHALRESALPSGSPLHVRIALRPDGMSAEAEGCRVSLPLELTPAKQPERTEEAVRKAFARMGESGFALASLALDDAAGLYAPLSKVNDLRRQLVEAVAGQRAEARRERDSAIKASLAATPPLPPVSPAGRLTVLKYDIRQTPQGKDGTEKADELVLDIGQLDADTVCRLLEYWREGVPDTPIRLALPVLTRDDRARRAEQTIDLLFRRGYTRWEAADLAGLRRLRRASVEDLTSDWTLYAFNRHALAALAELGIRRAVLSPENPPDNLTALALPFQTEFPLRLDVPLFISYTRPCTPDRTLASRIGHVDIEEKDGVWATLREEPFTHSLAASAPAGFAAIRIDRSWRRKNGAPRT